MSDWVPFGVSEDGDTIERREAPDKNEIEYRILRGAAFVRCAATLRLEQAFASNAWLFTAFINRMAAAL